MPDGGDFLLRLAQRTLGVAPLARPAPVPMFAPGPSLVPDDDAGATWEPAVSITEAAPAALTPHAALPAPRQPELREEATPAQEPRAPEQPRPEIRTRMLERRVLVPVVRERISAPAVLVGPAPSPTLASMPTESQTDSAENTAETVTSAESTSPGAPQSPVPHPTQANPRRAAWTHPLAPPAVPVPVAAPEVWQTPVATQRSVTRPAPEESRPQVRISIGRVEVRAVTPAPPATTQPAPPAPGPRLSLDEYLRLRDRGGRG